MGRSRTSSGFLEVVGGGGEEEVGDGEGYEGSGAG